MRRFALIAVMLVVCVAACGRGDDPAASGAPGASVTGPVSPSPSILPSASPTIPSGIPPYFDEDVAAEELPFERADPSWDRGHDRLLATTAGGDAVVIMYATRGADPFMRAQGFVVWRRTEGASPPWRPVFGLTHPKTEASSRSRGSPVMRRVTDRTTRDLRGDGRRRRLRHGGESSTSRRGAQRWHRTLCDAHVDLGVDPIRPGPDRNRLRAWRLSLLPERDPHQHPRTPTV